MEYTQNLYSLHAVNKIIQAILFQGDFLSDSGLDVCIAVVAPKHVQFWTSSTWKADLKDTMRKAANSQADLDIKNMNMDMFLGMKSQTADGVDLQDNPTEYQVPETYLVEIDNTKPEPTESADVDQAIDESVENNTRGDVMRQSTQASLLASPLDTVNMTQSPHATTITAKDVYEMMPVKFIPTLSFGDVDNVVCANELKKRLGLQQHGLSKTIEKEVYDVYQGVYREYRLSEPAKLAQPSHQLSLPEMDNRHAPRSSSSSSRIRYSMAFKAQVLSELQTSSGEALARKYQIDPRLIRGWKSNRQKIMDAKPKSFRIKGGGRKVMFAYLDQPLLDFLSARRHSGQSVSRRDLRLKARDLAQNVHPDFSASNCWLRGFVERYNLSTHLSETKDNQNKPVSCILSVGQKSTSGCYSLSQRIIAEETEFLYDTMTDATTERVKVDLNKRQHNKTRYTVLLAARANGTKEPPCIIFKGKPSTNGDQNIKCSGANIYYNENGQITDELAILWLRQTVGQSASKRSLLLWYGGQTHQTSKVVEEARRCKTDVMYAPARSSNFVNTPDAPWSESFKGTMRKLHQNWLTESTANKSPTEPQLAKWVIASWDAVSEDIVVNSFKSSGFTFDDDDWEDQAIVGLHQPNQNKLVSSFSESRKRPDQANDERRFLDLMETDP